MLSVFKSIVFIFFFAFCSETVAQKISGNVKNEQDELLVGALLTCSNDLIPPFYTDSLGRFSFDYFGDFPFDLRVSFIGYESVSISIADFFESLNIQLIKSNIELDNAQVISNRQSNVEWLNAIEGGAIYNGIKSSVIQIDNDLIVPGEVQARSIFFKIPGVNIWESDAAGLQIGVGVRGLNPNRSSHLSVRQQGATIAADPLGYPESYYTPPIEALEEIEYVSGASALQYGSQLGGMLNYKIKKADFGIKNQNRLITSFTTYAKRNSNAINNFNFFSDVQGSEDRSTYYLCIDSKHGEGWRDNTEFDSRTFISSFQQKFNLPKGTLLFSEELTLMERLEKQPGGLTDVLFEDNPTQSFRNRNWFNVKWNILRAGLDYSSNNNKWGLHLNAFMLNANRQALGYLGSANRTDPEQERDLIYADFDTKGMDARLRRVWNTKKSNAYNAFIIGVQGYNGITHMMQGLADSTSDPNFTYLNPNNLEGSDYLLPNIQYSCFAHAVISFGNYLSISPGIRYEYIDTQSDGWYRNILTDLAGNIMLDTIYHTLDIRKRSVILPGVSFSYKNNSTAEFYANAVENYRAINFSDIQIRNLGVVIDPEIEDESGVNIDFGVRRNGQRISYDISAFMLKYTNKIGVYPTVIDDPIFGEKPVFLRSNVSDARTLGLEGLISSMIYTKAQTSLNILISASVMRGKYVGGDNSIFTGNEIENIPNGTFRSVLTYVRYKTRASVQWNWVASQFTDATNSTYDPNAVYGEIPSYSILDFSFNYSYNKKLSIALKFNNLLNNIYFTRRASGYPGPGIIPSDGRNIRLSILVNNF